MLCHLTELKQQTHFEHAPSVSHYWNMLQKKFISKAYTMNFCLHWQPKTKITTEGTGTRGSREVLVSYNPCVIQNITILS